MDAAATATRKDIDDVLSVLGVMMTRIDERFSHTETKLSSTQKQIQNILTQLDHIEKRLEISEDERLVMAHQLTQLHQWVEKAAARICQVCSLECRTRLPSLAKRYGQPIR